MNVPGFFERLLVSVWGYHVEARRHQFRSKLVRMIKAISLIVGQNGQVSNIEVIIFIKSEMSILGNACKFKCSNTVTAVFVWNHILNGTTLNTTKFNSSQFSVEPHLSLWRLSTQVICKSCSKCWIDVVIARLKTKILWLLTPNSHTFSSSSLLDLELN